jgi:hypothetical protein
MTVGEQLFVVGNIVQKSMYDRSPVCNGEIIEVVQAGTLPIRKIGKSTKVKGDVSYVIRSGRKKTIWAEQCHISLLHERPENMCRIPNVLSSM